jgi:hypothetical protein
LVLNAGPNRVTLAEQSRWAEPLKDSIPRVIAADLARKLPDAYVTASPQTTMSHPDYTVLVDVQRFESAQGQAAIIEITWAVDSPRGGSRTAGKSYRREPVHGDDIDALISAHQRALDAASRDIAEAIKGKTEKTTSRH